MSTSMRKEALKSHESMLLRPQAKQSFMALQTEIKKNRHHYTGALYLYIQKRKKTKIHNIQMLKITSKPKFHELRAHN